MEKKYKIADILLQEFQYIYCDTCRSQDSDNCQDCHRKYINWSLSSETAIKIAEKILTNVNVEEEQYEHCDSYTIMNGKSRCLGTKEIDLCNCEGNKYQCNFYNLTSK